VALILAVFAAVYHAEVVAHRTGEPFGTLVLAVAVTIIEVALIVSVMVAASAEKAGLARDTVFAVVMIVCNGIVGLCLLWGGARHHEQGFQVHGASAALAVLAALTMLTLVLPNFATRVPGPLFSTSQLVFAGTVSLVTAHSFSSRPCGTETTSSQANPTTRKRPGWSGQCSRVRIPMPGSSWSATGWPGPP
jgi:Ca2+:H+ antiporter